MTSKWASVAHTTLACVALTIPIGNAARAQTPRPKPQSTKASQYAEPLPPPDDEIIVTARKREETSLAVPVVLTAVSQEMIDRRAISGIDAIAQLVPGLVTGEAGGIIGGEVALRGISGADANPFADQAVAFNVDGVSIARATVRRMAEMDLAQVEVLKGPQALFFGKNSPGGVISIRTADPTTSFSARASLGYEFNAREWRGEAYVSGPLAPALGFRLAGFVSDMRGWFINDAPATGAYAPKDRRVPNGTEYALRGTLKWEPDPAFGARLKLTYGHLRNSGLASTYQLVDCPYGASQFGDPDACRADKSMIRGDLGPTFGQLDPVFGDGVPFYRQRQWLASAELNYRPADTLTLTSVTGLYDISAAVREQYSTTAMPALFLASAATYHIREISQELRARSGFSGPFDFLLGAYFQTSEASNATTVYFNEVAPLFLNKYYLKQNGRAFSAFAQAIVRPTDTLEVTAGGRYSTERKRLPIVTRLGLPIVTNSPRRDSWHNFSPEFTVSFRPTDRLTVFGSYKRGFLSGGFNAGASNFAGDLRYDQETIRGFEGGIKAAMLDRRLRMNIAAYNYELVGLQVSTLDVTSQLISNAGKVRVKGVEADFGWRPAIDGLQLHGAIAYNRARYLVYPAGCYRGQTQAMGCNLAINAAGSGTAQDLAGEPLPRAPEWSGNAGINYERAISATLKLGASLDANLSGGYFTDTTNKPASWQKHYALVDASLRLATINEGWEVALIGRNLANTYYFTRSSDRPLGGSAPGGMTGVLDDTQAMLSRGREIFVRLTLKFGG